MQNCRRIRRLGLDELHGIELFGLCVARETSGRMQPALREDRIDERLPDDLAGQVEPPLETQLTVHGMSVRCAPDEARERAGVAAKGVTAATTLSG